MIRIYCDWCGNEVKSGYYGNSPDKPFKLFLKADKHILKAEVTISLNGSYNSAHICNKCALKLCREGHE